MYRPWRAVPLFLLSFAALTLSAQLRFGDATPLTNTRYGSAPAAARLVSTGDALYAFWSTGAQLRMSKVVEGERRGGVSILTLRPQAFVDTTQFNGQTDFDAVWNGTHFVVAATLQATQTIVTLVVNTDAQVVSPVTTAVTAATRPELAWNGRNILMLYTAGAGTDTHSLLLNREGRAAGIAERSGPGEKDVASNGTTFAAVIGNAVHIYDSSGHVVRTRSLPGEITEAVIASNGSGYLVITSNGVQITAHPITSDGVLQSPSMVDEITPRVDRTGFFGPALAWTGTEWAVTYSESHIDKVTDLHVATLGANARTVASREGDEGTSTRSVAAVNGIGYTAWWPSGFIGLNAPLYSALPLAAGTARPLTYKAADQTLVATTESDSAILVVWRELADGETTLHVGTRSNIGDWQERTLAVGTFFDAVAASDGNNFAVFTTGGTLNRKGYRFDQSLRSIGSAINLPFSPEAAESDGQSYVIALGNVAARVLSSGEVTPTIKLTEATAAMPSIAFDGENYLFAWITDPQCQFLLCLGGTGIRAARITPQLTRLSTDDVVLAANTDVDRPVAAWTGHEFLVAWQDYAQGLIGAFVRNTGTRAVFKLASRTDLGVLDVVASDRGPLVLVHDQSNATAFRTAVLAVSFLGDVTQQSSFTHTAPVTGIPQLAGMADGRVAYSVSQFLDDAPQHGSSHVLLMVESSIPRPTAPRLSAAADDRTVGLTWTAPAGAVNGYRIEYRIGDGTWNEVDRWYGPNDHSASVRLSRAGERATFRVRAFNDGGAGPYSATVTVNAARRRAVR